MRGLRTRCTIEPLGSHPCSRPIVAAAYAPDAAAFRGRTADHRGSSSGQRLPQRSVVHCPPGDSQGRERAQGREFGVLHPRALNQANSLRVQAGWCAATIRKNFTRWVTAQDRRDFIGFLGDRYCPVGADNDPHGLNRHWKGNVRHWVVRLAGPVSWLKSAKSLEHLQSNGIYSIWGSTVLPTTKGRD